MEGQGRQVGQFPEVDVFIAKGTEVRQITF